VTITIEAIFFKIRNLLLDRMERSTDFFRFKRAYRQALPPTGISLPFFDWFLLRFLLAPGRDIEFMLDGNILTLRGIAHTGISWFYIWFSV
jgi:hypothetical protein